ncbi:hypothetical protein FOCC_FOCC008971 [Frankliniella occidentalis]|nr:hypothetical protein FOCC_FOCC008971 [Frankliniella occidentalis]
MKRWRDRERGLFFNRPAKLKEHVLTHQDNGYMCTVCNKAIKGKANFNRHVKSHEQNNKCDVCDVVYKHKKGLTAHLNRVHGPKLHDKRFKCAKCNYLAKSLDRLYDHQSRRHLAVRLCPFCLLGFKKPRSFVAHQRRCQMKNDVLKYTCFVCRKRFATLHEKNRHVKICRRRHNQLRGGSVPDRRLGDLPDTEDIGVWDEASFALRGVARVIKFYPGGSAEDLGLSLIHNKSAVVKKLREELELARGLKWSISVSIEASRETEENGAVRVEKETKTLFSETRAILVGSEEETEQVEAAFLDILNSAENLKIQGSAWVISHINYYELSLAKYKPLKGGSYIKTPVWLARKQIIVNVETKDNHECFRLSILAHLHRPEIRKTDPRSYAAHYNAIEFRDIPSSNMKIKDVKKFSKLNENFSLSVIGVEKKELFPLICPEERKETHITLLMLTKRRKRHFVLCTSLDTLLFSQNKHKQKKHFCCYCFNSFMTKERCVNHERECREFGGQKIKYPPPGSF